MRKTNIAKKPINYIWKNCRFILQDKLNEFPLCEWKILEEIWDELKINYIIIKNWKIDIWIYPKNKIHLCD
jgi:hypothetical protein